MDETYDIKAAFDTISKLFYKFNDIRGTGVTYNQLYTAITLELNSRGIYPNIVSKLIDKDIKSKRLLKIETGRYIMNNEYQENSVNEDNGCIIDNSQETSNVAKKESSDDDSEEKREASVKKTKSRVRRSRRVDDIDKGIEEELAPKNFNRSLLKCKNFGPGRRVVRKNTKYSDDFFMTTNNNNRKKKTQGTLTHEESKINEDPKIKSRPTSKRRRLTGSSETRILYKNRSRESVVSNDSNLVQSKSRAVIIENYCSEPINSKHSMLKSQCYLCNEYADVCNKEIFACSLCLNIAHNECIKDDEFYKKLKKWRCSDCLVLNPATCFTCDKEYNKSDGLMLMCDYCEEFFHVTCHSPPVKLPAPSSWRCYLCPNLSIIDTLIGVREDLRSNIGTFAFNASTKSIAEVYKPSAKLVPCQDTLHTENRENNNIFPPPSSTPGDTVIKTEPLDDYEQPQSNFDEGNRLPNLKFHKPDEPIPDVNNWTVNQVAEYFTDKFGSTIGNAFLSQDIDGKSLKLMSRDDVTDQLGLQLGTALKVLYYVRKIQLNTNEIHKLWT